MSMFELTILAHKDMKVVDKMELEKKIRAFGRIARRKVEGVKRLAYGIQGEEFALYLFYELELEGGKATRLSNSLNVDDMVLRYLLVKQDIRGEN